VNTKYVSMNMEPNGRTPPSKEMASGVRYHSRSGMRRGMDFTRHGLFGAPATFRPMTVPNNTSGKEMNNHMNVMTTIVPNGTAAKELYEMATAFNANAIAKHDPGNKPAVSAMALIQFFPSFLALNPPETYPPTNDVRA